MAKEGQEPNKKEEIMVWTCTVCGYQYDESVEKEPFEKLPDDWHCPICNAPKDAFQKEG
jgi:rubredoxin